MTSETVDMSLWLVPSEPDRGELRLHIDQLAIEHGTPSFEPHITLTSGRVHSDVLVTAIERVANETSALDLVAGNTGHGPERFKSVFIEFADLRLNELAAEVSAALGIAAPVPFRPHVSLMYASDLPLETRGQIATTLTFSGRKVRFDTLVASVPGAGIEDVARWQSTVIRPLTGTRRPV